MPVEENKDIVLRVWEHVNRQEFRAASEAVAPNFARDGEPVGREGNRQRYAEVAAAFPDVHYTVKDLVAEGDLVAVRYTLTGTHRGELQGIPATGNRVSFSGISIYRISDRLIAEAWNSFDKMELMQQLGVVPANTQAVGKHKTEGATT